jgi:PAS domain S-box-containing protein
MVRQDSVSELFWAAFKQSRNAMVLLDRPRRIVEVNGACLKLLGYARDDLVGKPTYRFVVDGPALSSREWAERLAVGHFTGETELLCADGSSVVVQWGVDTEGVTGSGHILLVALTTSRWGRHFRRSVPSEPEPRSLTERERDVVGRVAQGRTGPEIADELFIAPDTVRKHVQNAMTKTGARSRAHLVAKTLGDGQVLG